MKYCMSCGKELNDRAKFCTCCGKRCAEEQVIQDTAESYEADSLLVENENPVQNSEPKSHNDILQERSETLPSKVLFANKSNMSRNIGLACVVLCVILILICVLCSTPDEVNSSNTDEATTEATYPRADEYDKVLASGDGYYLVSKFEESYNYATTKYGVVDVNGNWICSLSSKNGFALAAQNVQNGYTEAFHEIQYDYIGEDMFLIRSACIILGEEEIPEHYRASWATNGCSMIVRVDGTRVGTGGYVVTRFKNGCMFTQSGPAGLVQKIEKNGNKTDVGYCKDYIAQPSAGLICLDYKFYDTETCEMRFDLTEYDLVADSSTLSFDSDGKLYFVFKNPAGTRYGVTINTDGEFVSEPQKTGG